MDIIDWAPGETQDFPIPARAESLRAGGVDFLTKAFRASGALGPDNQVARITQFEECPGGSTGRKLFLSVEYAKPSPELHNALFVKFSRDFDDEYRDRAKIQMASEVRFATLSRFPGFPITVPKCYYADYHTETGTGIQITQRIFYDRDGIEPHHEKCQDYEIPDQFGHYHALILAIARLAGTHKAGHLPATVDSQFPFDPTKLTVSDLPPPTPEQLRKKVARLAEFADKFPRFLPANIAAPQFLARFAEEITRFPPHVGEIYEFLASNPDLIALCHWNANIDNGWFWRNSRGELEAGLLDWGHVSQMNVAMSIWGSMSAAETTLWDSHYDTLLALFVAEVGRCGGPSLDVEELRLHLELYIAVMGVQWLLDAPPIIQKAFPNLVEIENRFDPRFKAHELARNKLQMTTVFLNLWETRDFGTLLDRYLRHAN